MRTCEKYLEQTVLPGALAQGLQVEANLKEMHSLSLQDLLQLGKKHFMLTQTADTDRRHCSHFFSKGKLS